MNTCAKIVFVMETHFHTWDFEYLRGNIHTGNLHIVVYKDNNEYFDRLSRGKGFIRKKFKKNSKKFPFFSNFFDF